MNQGLALVKDAETEVPSEDFDTHDEEDQPGEFDEREEALTNSERHGCGTFGRPNF